MKTDEETIDRVKSLLESLDEALEDLEIWGMHSDQGYRKLKDWYRKVNKEFEGMFREDC